MAQIMSGPGFLRIGCMTLSKSTNCPSFRWFTNNSVFAGTQVWQGVQSVLSESAGAQQMAIITLQLAHHLHASSTTLGSCEPQISSEQRSELGWY